jgi:hypothetical protein
MNRLCGYNIALQNAIGEYRSSGFIARAFNG